MESEAMRGPGSIPTGGNILSLDFFHVVRASDANIGIIANFVYLRKPRFNGNIIFTTCDGDWFDVVEYVKLTVFECSKYSSGDSRNISPEPREIYIEANFLRLFLS